MSREIQLPAFWVGSYQQRNCKHRSPEQLCEKASAHDICQPATPGLPATTRFSRPAGNTFKGQSCSPILSSKKKLLNSSCPHPITVHLQLSFYTCEVKYMGLANRWEAGMGLQNQPFFKTEWGKYLPDKKKKNNKPANYCWFRPSQLFESCLPQGSKAPYLTFIKRSPPPRKSLQHCWLLKISCHWSSRKIKEIVIGMTCFYRLQVIYYENSYYL